MSARGVLLIFAAFLPAQAAVYTGAAACAKCHAEIHAKWSQSRHSKMVQPATKTSVKGDFTLGKLQLRGAPYALRERDGVYYITESTLTGKPQEHRVDYTLGNRRIQHYLTTLPTGRVIVLAPSWDVLRKQWFHNFDIADPDETSEVLVQVWNKNCFSCHVSRQQKGYDAAKNQYQTPWQDFGTNCERCHGPGSDHIAHYSAPVPPKGPARDIVLQTRLDGTRNSMVCAQCHSFRDIYALGYAAGDNYYDYFLPILESTQPVDKDPAYWPDGRTRRFSNDAFGLWQSECYLKGNLACTACHTAAHETEIERNPQLRPDANALCTRCHQALAKSLTAHTHHAEASRGSSCVECHMPRTVQSIKAEIRDHSMSVPVPENTIRHGIPNACNLCHKDQDAPLVPGKNEWLVWKRLAPEVDPPRRRLRRRGQGRPGGHPATHRDSEPARAKDRSPVPMPSDTWHASPPIRAYSRRCKTPSMTNNPSYAPWPPFASPQVRSTRPKPCSPSRNVSATP